MINVGLNKKSMVFMVVFCLHIFGAITQIKGQSDFPPWVNDSIPAHEIWGIGSAKLVNSRNSMNLAELRARFAIVAQLHSELVSEDYDFVSAYMLEASFEIMHDTRVLKRWTAPDGTSWCLAAMKKSDAVKYNRIIENIYQRSREVF
ncbi:hypothetical protein Holit_00349 [Hollandina sp. SP2]